MKAYFAKEIITEAGSLAQGYLLEEQGKITGVVREPIQNIPVIAYEEAIIAPGFIDVHAHGALGYETGFGEKSALSKWTEYQIAHGVTGFLPSTASIPLEKIKKAAEDIRDFIGQPIANVLGFHMEGPFFAPGPKIGAQNPQYLRNQFDSQFRDFISDYRDVIRYVSVDPALETTKDLVSYCNGLGIRVAAAHSEILYEDFLKRKSWGFSSITHTFNGMIGLDHRHPGLAYSACMDQDIYSEIICDGYHVSYPMLKLFFKLKGYQKTILITDSMAATGMSPGSSYTLGDIQVNVTNDGRVTKKDGGLAGSTLSMDQAVRNIVRHLEMPLHEAIYMASTAPAKMLGIDQFKGSLQLNKDADFVVLDSDLKVIATYMKGRNMFSANS